MRPTLKRSLAKKYTPKRSQFLDRLVDLAAGD